MVRALLRSLETPGYSSLSERNIHGPNLHRQGLREERQNHFWRQNPLCPEMGGTKTTVACLASSPFMSEASRDRTHDRAARSHSRLLSRDFSDSPKWRVCSQAKTTTSLPSTSFPGLCRSKMGGARTKPCLAPWWFPRRW